MKKIEFQDKFKSNDTQKYIDKHTRAINELITDSEAKDKRMEKLEEVIINLQVRCQQGEGRVFGYILTK